MSGYGHEISQYMTDTLDANSKRKQKLEDEQRQADLGLIKNSGISPDKQQALVRLLYGPENKKGQQYPAPSVTTQAPPIDVGGTTVPAGPPVTVQGPAPKNKGEALQQGLAQYGKSPQQLEQEKQGRALETYRGQQGAKADIDRQQSIQSIQDFKQQYKSATGQEPPAEMLQAFVLSALGGDKVLSGMTQAESLKAREEYQQATLQLRQSSQELAKAKFDASQDPNNPTFRLRLQQAQTAALRSQAMWVGTQARVFGTVGGEALPGAMTDAEGNPIGSAFSSNVRPTGAQREKATLATSARDQIADMKGILQSRSDLFGPGAGRVQKMRQWIGSQDPDAQRFVAAATTAADHLMGVFGGRSTWAGQRIEAAMGELKTNPEAAIAAMEQFDKAAAVIQKVGSYQTVGGGASSPTGGKGAAPKKGKPKEGDTKKNSSGDTIVFHGGKWGLSNAGN